MTLRDYFAAKAMQELIRHELGPDGVWQHICDNSCAKIANQSHMMADAMLAERSKGN
jgi:hypothetical protein